jgi:deazaflavin-dependent oxidoreductase (nitroreductase family)
MHVERAAAPAHADPAEATYYRWFYRGWRPTRLGRWINKAATYVLGLGLWSRVATLEVRGRVSGAVRVTPVVIAYLAGKRYLVSILGVGADWVKNVEAARGAAVLHQGQRHAVRLASVPVNERAPVLREYVRVAPGGRMHFPVKVGAPLSEFEAIAERHPVYRIDPADG